MNDILILGDSTSMTIGLERKMYPYILADEDCWEKSTRFINCSQPGFTSADACAFFFDYVKTKNMIQGVIIHLGTCDSIKSEVKKGKYSFGHETIIKIKQKLGVKIKRSQLKNTLLHYKWNRFIDNKREDSEPVDDFEFNLDRVLKYCSRKRIKVVLVHSISHVNFPTGLAKGNFVFYRYIGINDIISHRLDIENKDFIEALGYQEKNQHVKAQKLYKKILLSSDKNINDSEFLLMLVNNYAVCAVEIGDLEEAEYLFNLLLEENGIRKEIILFNMAKLKKKQLNEAEHQKILEASYHSDDSMYRIRGVYQDAILRLYNKYQDKIFLVSTNTFIDDSQFVDHCHPLPVAQKILANHIKSCFKGTKLEGQHSAKIINRLYNPELALGNREEFYTYYRTYAAYSEAEIKRYNEQLKDIIISDHRNFDQLMADQTIVALFPKEFSAAIQYYLTHPFFPTIRDLCCSGPVYPSDIGRFPEFFLIRFILPYIKAHESHPELKSRFNRKLELLRGWEHLNLVLPDKVKNLVENEIIYSEEIYSNDRIDRVLSHLKQRLLAHTKKGSQIYERLKTTIFWFFRETLRYGPHSRICMRYERVFLEYSAESLAACGVIDKKLNGTRTEKILKFIQYLQEITLVHEKYCSAFDMECDNDALVIEYGQKLITYHDQIKLL